MSGSASCICQKLSRGLPVESGTRTLSRRTRFGESGGAGAGASWEAAPGAGATTTGREAALLARVATTAITAASEASARAVIVHRARSRIRAAVYELMSLAGLGWEKMA
jgi:hypothetical protein